MTVDSRSTATPPRPQAWAGEPLSLVLYVASRVLAARCRPRLGELGLTFPQYLVMLVLWERGPVTVTELGDVLGLDSGTLSPLLKRLEFAGLVDRRRQREDERRVEVSSTPAGDALRGPAQELEADVRAALPHMTLAYEDLLRALRELIGGGRPHAHGQAGGPRSEGAPSGSPAR